MISSTVERLECTAQVASAPNSIAITYSSCMPSSAATKDGELRIGSVPADKSLSDSSMRPRPIATRPRWRALSDGAERKAMTPMAIISGESQLRSNDRTCEVRVVPTLAPSITAIAIGSVMSPRPANDASKSAVAVLD